MEENKLTSNINNFFYLDWESHLINNFYFTKKTAEELFKNKNVSYQNLYEFCQNYVLNSFHEQAFEALASQGLTKNHLKGRDWLNTLSHVNALEALMSSHTVVGCKAHRAKLTAQAAIAELDGTRESQAAAIQNGLSRADVIDLNDFQVFALYMLRGADNCDLTADHLKGHEWFNSREHADALLFIMRVGYKGEAAVNILKTLNDQDHIDRIISGDLSVIPKPENDCNEQSENNAVSYKAKF